LYNKNKIESKILENTIKYKRFIEEGAKLTIAVRRRLPASYKVEYFNEKTLERIELKKNKEKSFLKKIKKSLGKNNEKHYIRSKRFFCP
jgi:flagellar biosynthesis component FlhA